MISAQQAAELALDAARSTGVDETIVLITDRSEASLRWANNTMTTNGQSISRTTTVISFVHQGDTVRVASLRSAEADPAAIADLVAASADAARSAPEARDAAPLVTGDRCARGLGCAGACHGS